MSKASLKKAPTLSDVSGHSKYLKNWMKNLKHQEQQSQFFFLFLVIGVNKKAPTFNIKITTWAVTTSS